jgi:hypothetical protein
MGKKTYNSGDSLVVTDPTTNPPVSGLTKGERTGSRIFHYLWSYVLELAIVCLMIMISCMSSVEMSGMPPDVPDKFMFDYPGG